MREFH